MMSPVSATPPPPPGQPVPEPAVPVTRRARPAQKAGCFRIGLMLVGSAIVLAVVAGLTGWAILQLKSNPSRSGDSVADRPVGPENESRVPTSIPPGAEDVEPLADDQMLVSVADNPPLDPCGGSGPDLDVEVMGTDGANRRRISADPALDAAVNTDGEEIWARISPDRRRFVFYRAPVGKSGEHCRYFSQELWIANVDGTGVRKIFSNDQKEDVATQQGWPVDQSLQGHADWSPDGRHVVMVLGHSPSIGPIPLLNQGETQLFNFEVDSGDLTQVTRRRDAQGRGLTSDPSYTPDGSTIVFVGCPDRQPSCDDMQILAVPADADKATTTRVVFDGEGRGANDVYVSPDGRSISWMEFGLLETKLFVAPFQLGREIRDDELTLVDAHGGYANWTADSRNLIYSRLWLTDRFALFSNRFDDQPSRRISPAPTSLVFVTPSPS